MKKHHHAATWKLLLLLLLIPILGSLFPYAAVSASALQRSQPDHHNAGLSRSPGRSLLSHPPPQRISHFEAAREGKLLLVDSNSGAVIYGVDLGRPLYSSYQAPQLRNNVYVEDPNRFYLDADEDGRLYSISNGIKRKLDRPMAEFVLLTPHTSDDGSVTVGSMKTTTYVIDPWTGRIIHRYPSTLGEEQGLLYPGIIKRIKQLVKLGPTSPNSAMSQLQVLVTEFTLMTYFPKSNEVAWNLTFCEIGVVSFCSDIENPVIGALDSEAGGDVASPLPCHSKVRVPHQRRISIEPPVHGRLLEEQNKHKILSNSASNGRKSPTGMLVLLFDRSRVWTLTFSFFILPGFVICCCAYVVSRQRLADPNALPSKSKKNQKSGETTSDIGEEENHVSSQDEEALAYSDGVNKTLSLDKLLYGAAVGRRIGKLLISDKEIAKGSNGTIVLEGIYEGRPVAVKRLVLGHYDMAFKEIQNLIASDRHPNIVRWYGVEYDRDFVYLSLERCICNLDDLIQIHANSSQNPVAGEDHPVIQNKVRLSVVKNIMPDVNLWEDNGLLSPLLLKLMRDVVSGLVHLHELGIIHRDLKPQNVLLIKEGSLCAKLSDMGISKQLIGDMSSLGHHATGNGSSGWQAPEQLLHGRQTRAVDLFSLGCVLFFCITGGRHPFGDRLERDINIVKNQMDLFSVEYLPEALDLISRLLNRDPELRPKALEVLHHPLFWSSETRVSFLRDYSDRVELEDRWSNSDLLRALESTAPRALGGKWNEKMEPAFLTNIGQYRRYKFDTVRDLLRVMRNKSNHYRELPKEIQELLGPLPEGYDAYFASRFPKLLIEVYKVACKHCREEEWFQKYFKSTANESSGL
ncbi:serine/threonine-protein kinase/endoribonuclease IRE1a-like [Argentina anserina]|uniref:serine/threonine-protein kinase/endoribonuclease IRE1a-like n=1 Tax=Argentina anserina TaxID=57926 RepID=UPI0021769086|nr:serine/threonine-protein kinase/endoribonuclease IRE1a-like [Potentilla anserina]